MPQDAAVQALALATAYAAVAGAYIVGSGQIAEMMASSAATLAQIEQVKGIAFVGVTGAMLFGASWWMLTRRDRLAAALADQQEALVRAEARAVAGTMASAVAHDIRNVLTVLSLSQEALFEGALDEEQREALEGARRSTERLTALSGRLRDLARFGATPAESFDLGEVVREAAALASRHAALRSCKVQVVASPGLVLFGRVDELHQIVWNLLLNAGQALDGRGEVVIELGTAGDDVFLAVHDSGPGIPEQDIPKILAGLYTTRVQGTGLGLLSVQSCARRAGGAVQLGRSERCGGARVMVTLPRRAPEVS